MINDNSNNDADDATISDLSVIGFEGNNLVHFLNREEEIDHCLCGLKISTHHIKFRLYEATREFELGLLESNNVNEFPVITLPLSNRRSSICDWCYKRAKDTLEGRMKNKHKKKLKSQ